jgi:DNA replication protein DnaC
LPVSRNSFNDAFDFDAVPMVSKAQVQALAASEAWLEKGANLLCFGPPGGGKSHLAAALGMALIEKGWRVLFTRTTDLVQKLQIARRDLVLEAAIAKLDKYHLLIWTTRLCTRASAATSTPASTMRDDPSRFLSPCGCLGN